MEYDREGKVREFWESLAIFTFIVLIGTVVGTIANIYELDTRLKILEKQHEAK